MAYDFGAGAAGAGTGAIAGAAGGPAGMAIGGVLGLLGGFGGKKDMIRKLEAMNPEQLEHLSRQLQMLGPEGQVGQAFGQGMSGLQQMLDPSSAAYQRFEAPHLQQFEQQTVPGIAERFAGADPMGGALSSSGFGQSLSAAGGRLQTDLAGMKAGLQQNAIRDIMRQYSGMSGQAMGAQPFAYSYQPGSAAPGYAAAGKWMEKGMPGIEQAGKMFSDWWNK